MRGAFSGTWAQPWMKPLQMAVPSTTWLDLYPGRWADENYNIATNEKHFF